MLGSQCALSNYEEGQADECSMISLSEALLDYSSRQTLQDWLVLGGPGQRGCTLTQR